MMIRKQLHTMSANRAPAAPPRPMAPSPAARRSAKLRRCDYQAPAALFVRESTRLRYQSFGSVAEAVRYANEELDANKLRSCRMEVDETDFDGEELRALYLAEGYPLDRAAN
jgi:hypothetical protein